MSIARIITVDPTWTLSRILRAALDLLDRPVIQIDVPGAAEALAEVKHGGCTLLITNYEVDDKTRGFELALRVKQESSETAVIILGDIGDPSELDPETAAESPFAYLRRPMDVQKFLRVLQAGLDGTNQHDAMFPSAMAAPTMNIDLGPIPTLDLAAATGVIDALRIDLAAQSILFATRTGEVLLERGAVGIINRDKLTASLLPAVLTNIEAKELLGGQLSSVQFYDGDDFDVFVLTVGLHHFICAVFDGQNGARQFGAVNRFGRKAVEELIAKIGAAAFFLQPRAPIVVEDYGQAARKKAAKVRETEEVDLVPLARAEIGTATPAPDVLKFDPIVDLNLDDIFGTQSNGLDADALFDMDDLETMANENTQAQTSKGKLDWDKAREIGLIPE
ncbi:MAG: hypothetical protein H7Y11_01815 [Armatimonadetes bacterium]|nr:hypothetical protein [Anaerolineae bacterium]